MSIKGIILKFKYLRISFAILLFISLLSIIGFLLSHKMSVLIDSHLENITSMYTTKHSELIESLLHTELNNLSNTINFIYQDKNSDIKIIEKYFNYELKNHQSKESNTQNIIFGVKQINGKTILGTDISIKDIPIIKEALHGTPAVSYKKDIGFIFIVPLYNKENIKYVVYKIINSDYITKYFNQDIYLGNSPSVVINKEHEIIFSNLNNYKVSLDLNSDLWTTSINELKEKMKVSKSASILKNINGQKSLVFATEIKNTPFIYLGYVHLDNIKFGLDKSQKLVMWVFGLLVIIFIVGLIYLYTEEDKIRLNNFLRKEKIAAEKANKAKSFFLANMSHEIRTPLNAIMGMNEMILRKNKEPIIYNYASDIKNASENLLGIINDILDFSKIESGKIEIIENNYELSELISNVITIIDIKTKEKQLELITNIDKNIPKILLGDAKRLQQVIINILNNAIKYTPKGSITFSISSQINNNIAQLSIIIEDTGIGIKKEDLKKLFNSFQRLELNRNRNIEGTGLGLAISHSLIQAMKGTVNVTSTYNVGSKFTITIPQTIIDSTPIENSWQNYNKNHTNNKYVPLFTAPNANILIVDDNKINRMLVKELLSETKVQCTLCASGAECIEEVKKKHFDIILLDHMMPDMDGIETLQHLRKMPNNLSINSPILVLTANAIIGVKEEYLGAGFTDYLTKPINNTTLEQALIKYLPKDIVTLFDNSSITPTQNNTPNNSHENSQNTNSTQLENADNGNNNIDKRANNNDDNRVNNTNNAPLSSWLSELNQIKNQNDKPYLHINIEKGLEYTAGDESLYKEIITAYCDEHDENEQKLIQHLEDNNLKNFAIVSHAIKSTSKTIGLMNFAESAYNMEKAGKENNEQYILENIQNFTMQYNDIYNTLNYIISTNNK